MDAIEAAKQLDPDQVAQLLGVVRSIAQSFEDEGQADYGDLKFCVALSQEIDDAVGRVDDP